MVIVVLGPTACGKSDLAEALAAEVGAGIVAADSMQVYRGMDIGTAKPTAEVRARIRHDMIDVADPWEAFSAARYAAGARAVVDAARAARRPVIVVGGTMLYVRALMEGLFEGPGADAELREKLSAEAAEKGTAALHERLAAVDPVAAGRIHPNDLRRIVRGLEVHTLTGSPISSLQTQWAAEHPALPAKYVVLQRDKEALNRRINTRVKGMLAAGLLAEVQRLRGDPRGMSQEAAAGVGYKELLDYFAGRCRLEDAVERIKIQTRHLAKLQRTWLKRWPPMPPANDSDAMQPRALQQSAVHWLRAEDSSTTSALLEETKRFLGV